MLKEEEPDRTLVGAQMPISTDPLDVVLPSSEIEIFERYRDFLSNAIASNSISQQEFNYEMLKTNYYIDIKTKTFVLDDKQKEDMDQLIILKKKNFSDYENGILTKEKFEETYSKILRIEYSILKSAVEEEKSGIKIEDLIDKDYRVTLQKLEKAEESQITRIAQKKSIKFPEIPTGYTAKQIEDYYDLKIKGKPFARDENIEKYIKKYRESKKMVDYHTDSYTVSKIFYNEETGKSDFKFEVTPSIIGTVNELKDVKRSNLLTPDELAYTNRIKILKNMMRLMSKEQLIKCAEKYSFKYRTLIGNLEFDKKTAFKFYKPPDNFENLKSLLKKDLIDDYRILEDKISENDFFKPFSYTLTNTYLDDTVQEETIEHSENGKESYLAIDEQEELFTIFPIAEEFNKSLKTLKGENTEIVDVWILHKPDGVTKRYLSFEKFLLELKNELVEKIKNYEARLEARKQKGIPPVSAEIGNTRDPRPVIEYPIVNYPPFQGIGPEQGPSIFPKRVLYPASANSKIPTRDREQRKSIKRTTILDPNIEALTKKISDIQDMIKKIDYHLTYKEDIEEDSGGQINIEELLKKEEDIRLLRDEGLISLLSVIVHRFPGSENVVLSIEAEIFNFGSLNYKKNIKKVLFIFNNYPEILNDVVTGLLSILYVLNFETPSVIPDEDLKTGEISSEEKQNNIDLLLQWKPSTDKYDKYQAELEELNHNFEEFKKKNPQLRNLDISEIMSQYSEKIQWNSVLSNYKNLEVPEGYVTLFDRMHNIEINFRLRHLIRQRNKLPSRRIFNLATVETRIASQDALEDTFKRCRLNNILKLAILVESTIYSLSKIPEDYMYYNFLINTRFIKLCENLKILEEINSIEFQGLILLIIKFVISSGELEPDSDIIKRIMLFNKDSSPEERLSNLETFKKLLSSDELEGYEAGLIAQINLEENSRLKQLGNLFLKDIRTLKTENMRKRIEEWETLISNKFIPPIVSDVPPRFPKVIDGQSVYKNFIKVNDSYIYGGHFPPFYRYKGEESKKSELAIYQVQGEPNYTRNELLHLAEIFGIEKIPEDDFELYTSIKNFMETYRSTPGKEVIVINPVIKPKNSIYLSMPDKNIMYTYRPRLRVKEPGEIYAVYYDDYVTYGVPYKFTPDTIPIYTSELSQYKDGKFITIEGPLIFKEDGPKDIASYMSNYYILVEYTDHRGNKKLFREGVAVKRVFKKMPSDFFGCERFKTEQDCNDPASFSLEINKERTKCKWLRKEGPLEEERDPATRDGICTGVLNNDEEFKQFDIEKAFFKDIERNALWKAAVSNSIKSIEKEISKRPLSPADKEYISLQEKQVLFDYYNFLSNEYLNVTASVPTEAVGSIVLPASEESLIAELGLSVSKKTTRVDIPGYLEFTLYRYDTVDYEAGSSGSIRKKKINYKAGTTIKIIPLYCLIKKDDYDFLTKYKNYYWKNINTTYDKKINTKGKTIIIKVDKEETKNEVPANFIIPTGEMINGKQVITRDDIFEGMVKTAFRTLKTDDSLIYTIHTDVDAEEDAVRFALKNGIDILEKFKDFIGILKLTDLTQFQKTVPDIKTVGVSQLRADIENAIKEEDIKSLNKLYISGRSVLNKEPEDKKLMQAAQKVIRESKKKKPEPLPEPPPEPEPVVAPAEAVQPKQNPYVNPRRNMRR